MCAFAGMKSAAVCMIPVKDNVYRDKCAHLNQQNNIKREKAHLYS